MTFKRAIAAVVLLAACLFSTACFSVEQEVFLNADGSGELVFHLSVPDLPEDIMKQANEVGASKDTDLDLQQITKDINANATPGVKVKEVKTVRQNGVQGVYVLFQFSSLNDMNAALANIGKNSVKESAQAPKTEWKVGLARTQTGSVYSGTFLLDLDGDKKSPKKQTPKMTQDDAPNAPKLDEGFEKLGEQLTAPLSGTMRMRFVLHAPSTITNSNADIVLNGRTAVWNCSPTVFLKDKKPIQMRAVF